MGKTIVLKNFLKRILSNLYFLDLVFLTCASLWSTVGLANLLHLGVHNINNDLYLLQVLLYLSGALLLAINYFYKIEKIANYFMYLPVPFVLLNLYSTYFIRTDPHFSSVDDLLVVLFNSTNVFLGFFGGIVFTFLGFRIAAVKRAQFSSLNKIVTLQIKNHAITTHIVETESQSAIKKINDNQML